MLELLIKILCSFIITLFSFLIVKNITKSKIKLFSIKNIALIILVSCISSVFLFSRYSIIVPICSYIILTILFKIIYNFNLIESIIITGILMIILFLSETFLSLLIMSIIKASDARSNYMLMITLNTLVGIIGLGFVSIPSINNIIYTFIYKTIENKIIKAIVFIVSTFLASGMLFLVITNNFNFNLLSIVSIVIIGIFILLFVLYMQEQNEYNKLYTNYDLLLNYVSDFEEWIDTVELNKHEYKNDLAVLRMKVTDKSVKDFIDNKLTKKMDIDERWTASLKSMPNGGMKGLLYYKIVLAKNNKVDLHIDISPKTKKYFKDIKEDDYKNLCHLFGIYIDNALEAAINSKEKSISVEIYELNNKLNIVISNSFSGEIKLNQLNEKGYTTKGKGHGKGLHFAQKILKGNNKFYEEHIISNNFYVQRLYINNN